MLVRVCALFAWMALALAVAPVIRAQESALIRVGETWRYLRGLQEPSNPVEAWRMVGFNDQAWQQGISGFSNGYGAEYDEPTRLPDLGSILQYTSIYTRKEFVVTNLTLVRWLTLRIDYNDGFVAYLNGTEVARRNIPGEPGSFVPFNTVTGTRHARGLGEEIDITSAAALLTAGTNVLAIQLHTSAPTDFDFSLLPELLCNFTRGPFIQNSSTNRTQVIWKTSVPSNGWVQYGTTPEMDLSVSNALPSFTHAIALENLEPDTVYYYQVRSQAGTNVVESSPATFRTLKHSGSLSFAVFGDSGSGSIAQYRIADQMIKATPDLVLHVGDVIYPLFTTNWSDPRCLSVYQRHMRNTPFYFSIGNHDLYGGDFAYLDSFHLPTNSMTGTEHFYSFDHGDAHFTVLLQPYASQYLIRPGDGIRQYEWLTNDLARSSKPWKFLFLHVPIATSGLHRFDDYAAFGTPDSIDIRNAILPAAARHGVQFVFAGHDHNYERFAPMDGVTPVVTGGGGVAIRWLGQLDPASSQFWLQHHFTKITIESDWCRLDAIDMAGNVFDSKTIYRTPPDDELHAATWHTPVIEETPADDLDGNINGQRFDFAGTPLGALQGRFSSLGRVYVNNDERNLYLGVEESAIYPEHTIYLFLETPRVTGVTNLVGLGNGLPDPAGEGVDGIDLLENLSFTNFAPAVAALLGDEFGDAPARSFARFSAPQFNTGQGVFRLNTGLEDVPGVRMQQFNRIVQLGGFPGEESASFIELAIPLAELGNARPGDVLKLAALVGLGRQTNDTTQTRPLDTGFMGIGFIQGENGAASIEGVRVVLAHNPNGDEDRDQLTYAEEIKAGTNPANPDTDGDGMLDGWELAHRFDPLSALAENGSEGDPDNDGFSNLREQFHGTNPRDPRSAIRLAVVPMTRERFHFEWGTLLGRRYQLEFSDEPAGNYVNLMPDVFPLAAISTNQTFELDLEKLSKPGERTQSYFRVRLVE